MEISDSFVRIKAVSESTHIFAGGQDKNFLNLSIFFHIFPQLFSTLFPHYDRPTEKALATPLYITSKKAPGQIGVNFNF